MSRRREWPIIIILIMIVNLNEIRRLANHNVIFKSRFKLHTRIVFVPFF